MDCLIEVERDGKFVFVKPEELEVGELVEALCRINLDSDEFIPDSEIRQGYAAIKEAIRRLEGTSTTSIKVL